MSNKKGIELSINFVVVMVLSLIVFGFGIYLLTSVFCLTCIQPTSLCSEEEVTNMLGDSRVALCPNQAKAYGNVPEKFILGIHNSNSASSGIDQFFVAVEGSDAVDSNNARLTGVNWGLFEITYQSSLQISRGVNNGNAQIPIVVKAPSGIGKGTYIFDVRVCSSTSLLSSCGSATYGQQKLYLKIQ
ncbi:hypothetical protein HYY72_04735 [Candidatus Woesearchaeota archaeon]|nr:hypothetical protein [Candidatus Woesearchaeota archaeon]